MTNGQAAEPPPGTPSRRALGAMEIAVRRAREAHGDTPPVEPRPSAPAPAPARPPRSPGPVTAERGAGQDGTRRRSERWLTASVAFLAVLVGAAAIALVVSLHTGPRLAAPPSSSVTTAPSHAGASPSSSHTEAGLAGGRPGASATSTTTTTSSTTVPVAADGPPVISSLTPSSGSAGVGIVVAGANFLSSDGQIVATFNGQVAPTSCPVQDSCTVTVPPPSSGSTSALVTITTPSGTSNTMTFTYS
jgi:hypothetical protein